MGNNSSHSSLKSCKSISKPKYLAATTDKLDDENQRAATYASSQSTSSSFLAVPSGSHRRSRSEVASSSRPRSSAPPPPYAYAVANGASSTAAALEQERMPASAPTSPIHPVTGHPLVRRSTVEDALDTLRRFDTVIVMDDSGSMQGRRWLEARDALAALADIASRYDADGVDVCFLNSRKVGNNMKDSDFIRRLFNSVVPQGITPIGDRLEQLLLFYMDSLDQAKTRANAGDNRALSRMKPINYIVITDGAPTDDPEEVIVAAARRLDRGNYPLNQVGIQFVQIGDSADATAFLKELDDGLSQRHKIRDMVDTTPYTGGPLNGEMIIKILLGGINRRVDRRGARSVI